MPIRVSNLRLGLEEPEESLAEKAAHLLGLRSSDLASWRILRKSLDAREPERLAFVYSVAITLPNSEEQVLRRLGKLPRSVRVEPFQEVPFPALVPGTQPLAHPPVIIGSGPAGLAAAYFLSRAGFQPIILERGAPVSERIRDVAAFDAGGPHQPESNYLFGEGGAGTFSDGKLTYRGAGPEVQRILAMYAECKGKPSILYDHRPHLGSNRLPAVVKAQRQQIEKWGGSFRFRCRAEDLLRNDKGVAGVATSAGVIPADVVILAIGHSARDTFEMLLRRGVSLEPKPFQFGVRIEQPQEQVNRHCYGKTKLEDRLGAASYSVVTKTKGLDLFSFCMCAGGYVMPSVSTPGEFCTNGMSFSKHDSEFANSGLVVTLTPNLFDAGPLGAVEYQRRWERLAFAAAGNDYRCPIQLAADFLAGRRSRGTLPSSYPRGTLNVDLRELLPACVTAALAEALPVVDRKWKGRFLKEATLVGPEARGSSPVRLPRDEDTRMSIGWPGLYPVGEGAGYAGGIVSAAVDGLRTARAIIRQYRPLTKPAG